jgi:hypothetical protein
VARGLPDEDEATSLPPELAYECPKRAYCLSWRARTY